MMSKVHEKEKRKRELVMMKAYEAQRRAEVTIATHTILLIVNGCGRSLSASFNRTLERSEASASVGWKPFDLLVT